MLKQNLEKRFPEIFGSTAGALQFYFCPGRVNLIGEHIDYNGGFVFPGALTLGIMAAVRSRSDSKLRVASTNLPGLYELDLASEIQYDALRSWANYPAGMAAFLQNQGIKLKGADILFSGNLPDGAGVSSSAALEVLTGFLLMSEAGIGEIDKINLAKLAQRVENQFVGVNCGIMDQFSVAMGKENQAILLNCQTLEYQYAPLQLADYSLVILNTNKRRELAEGKYNERRGECDKSLAIINQDHSFKDLCSVGLDLAMEKLKDPILKARTRHVITENQRVLEAKSVLEKGDLKAFGDLLKASHHSLKTDYEVTGIELDSITEAANAHPACLGSRMTGAGFGGCGIALVKTSEIESFQNFVGLEYLNVTGLKADFYVSQLGEGVRMLS
jgi:galactokinase